jgi:hypothetical protein
VIVGSKNLLAVFPTRTKSSRRHYLNNGLINFDEQYVVQTALFFSIIMSLMLLYNFFFFKELSRAI